MGKLLAKNSTLAIGENGLEKASPKRRVEVLKTYKIYIGGQFPRTESGRYYIATNKQGDQLANVCLSSRKDFYDGIVVSTVAPVIVGGNACVILASETKPLCAVSFAEVINSSDVPGGVVNILTGKPSELFSHFASHMDVNAAVYCGIDDNIQKEMQQKG